LERLSSIQPFWHDTFLWSLDLETREHVELTTHVGDNFGGRYSPDGNFAAYHSNRLGDTDVWLLDVETGAEPNLTSHPGLDFFPDWSPDGNQLVFVSNREGTFDLYGG
jgi:TolB protein